MHRESVTQALLGTALLFKYFKITDFFRIWLHGETTMPEKQKKHKGIQSFALVFFLLFWIVYRYPIQQNIRKSNTGNFRNIVSLIFCETGKSLLGGM